MAILVYYRKSYRMRICTIGSGGVSGRALCDISEYYDVEVLGVVKSSERPPNKNITGWYHSEYTLPQIITQNERWDAVYDLRAFCSEDMHIINNFSTARVEHWFHFSSMYVYRHPAVNKGTRDKYEFDEASNCDPSDKYGINKLHCERDITLLGKIKFPVTIVRLPFVYGPNDRSRRIARYKKLLIEGCEIRIPDSGRHLIEMLYSYDLANILLKMISNSSTFGEVFNIACGKKFTLAEHIASMSNALGVTPFISSSDQGSRLGCD